MLLPVRIDVEKQKIPVVTGLLIGANAVIFLAMRFLPEPALEMVYHDYGFIPERYEPLTLLTSMFIHAGWLHVVGNMYFLWLYGSALEQRISRTLYAVLYFSSGIAGSALQASLTAEYLTDIPNIGASGAISGILGACMVLFPWEEVSCIYFSFALRYATSISLSALWVLASWFILQFVNALWFSSQTAEDMVGFWAHIGGFIFGASVCAAFEYSGALGRMLRRRSAASALEEYSDLAHKGRKAQATAKLKAALAADPNDPLTLAEIGRLALAGKRKRRAREHLDRSLKNALKRKDDAKAVSAFLALAAAGERPDNSRRLVIGRRFARLGKYGHALGIMGGAFEPGAELSGLDKLLYEIAEIYAGALKDFGRAQAAYSVLKRLFPHSPRALDAEYQLRKLRAAGKQVLGD